MPILAKNRRFSPTRRRENASIETDLRADGIDEEILAAGFWPVPFRYSFKPLTKHLPNFLRPRKTTASAAPDALQPRQLSLPPLGKLGTMDTDHRMGAPASTVPSVLISGAKKSNSAIAAHFRHSATTEMLSERDHTVPKEFPWPSRTLVLVSVGCLVGGILIDHTLLKATDYRLDRYIICDSATKPSQQTAIPRLTSADEDGLDAAYSAQKEGRYAEAKERFFALKAIHPKWDSIDAAIGTTEMYQKDLAAAQVTFKALTNRKPDNADASFRMGILFTVRRAYDQAEAYFAAAVMSDPSRPEYYYFWGECLHQEGKSREAAGRFRSALLRNEFDASTCFYQLKLWLCEIEADLEDHNGTSAQIDSAMASPNPPMEALIATAARNIKAGDFHAAAHRLLQARALVTPTLYSVIVQDPIFLQEQWRPELAQVFETRS